MVGEATTPWIVRTEKYPQLRLFCFPYAGGGASIFRLWSRYLPEEVEVCPLYLPGREHRLKEPAFDDMTALVRKLTEVLEPYLDIPFAFAGHSMGGLICFELARQLRREQLPEPRQLFISAQRAPQLPSRHDPIYQLPDAEFLASLYRLGGTPQAVLENEELMQIMLPMLRADFTLYNTYVYTPEAPLDCAISAFFGEQDHLVSSEELAAWREHTCGTFVLRGIPGNHFFLHSSLDMFLRAIEQDLLKLLR
jgi:medium-chain acyl-[acyl-carrier-protein] hydrolase